MLGGPHLEVEVCYLELLEGLSYPGLAFRSHRAGDFEPAGGGRYLTQASGIARLMSGLRQSRATAAFFNPKLHKVRASSRAAQLGSGIVVPKLIPVPTNAPPPETDPRHVSSPAAARPGAKTLGTFLTV